MKTLVVGIAIVAAALFLCRCEDQGSGTGVGPVPSGAYRYTSYDTNGVPVVRGWITLVYQDSPLITGEWRLDKIGDPQGIGHQIGSGRLVGSFQNGKLVIELNPQFRDNNLQLVGEFNNGEYKGEWFWISFIGITNRGTFRALQE